MASMSWTLGYVFFKEMTEAEEVSQSLSVILQRANAQSILRRAPSAGDPRPSAVARAATAIERSEATRLAAMPADGQ